MFTLTLDFSLTLLVLLFQLRDVLIASAHNFRIVIEESSVLNQTLLQLVIFLSQFGFTSLELKLLLREMFLLRNEGLLILVHLSSLI